ncbi:MAG: hypothetical protein NT060_03105 [Candidatus Omnitrophica bacterium]|nr:hypothetical protein [Candidatus Omnitrophota bacterium]
MKLSNKGFTFAEILLAAAILAFALCALLATYISCIVLYTTSKNVNIATNAALGLAEEIRTDSFSRIYSDYNNLTFIVNDIPSSRGVVYVNQSNPEFLTVTISVCWRQGNKIFGEDTNLNGVLNAGEDTNSNGIIDSPVQIITRIVNR